MYYRDMALYALLAATGARSHEALQVRLCDLKEDSYGHDVVELHSPFIRNNPGITESEYDKLSWKGRATEKTFMIEPFASIFWEHLHYYLRIEFNASVAHDFLFQAANGRPLFASDRSSRDKTFKRYARTAGITDMSGISLHSLRHMYGTYVLNYLPVPDKDFPGLPPAYVQILMGHASLSSTNRYAKHDLEMVDSYLQHANQLILHGGESSLQTVTLDFYKRQLNRISEEIRSLEGHS